MRCRWRQCAVASQASASYTSAGLVNGVFSFERELSLISNLSGKASRASAHTASPTLSMLTRTSSGRRPFRLSTYACRHCSSVLRLRAIRSFSFLGLCVPPPALGAQLPRCCCGGGRSPRAACSLRPAADRGRLDGRRVSVGLLRPGARFFLLDGGLGLLCRCRRVLRSCLARAIRSCHSAVNFRIRPLLPGALRTVRSLPVGRLPAASTADSYS